MRPPAFTPGLKGRLGLPPVEMICFVDDWAWVMMTAAVTKASTESTRMDRSSDKRSVIVYGPKARPEGRARQRRTWMGRPSALDNHLAYLQGTVFRPSRAWSNSMKR